MAGAFSCVNLCIIGEFNAFLASKYPEVPETIARDKTLAETTVDALKKAIADFKSQFKA